MANYIDPALPGFVIELGPGTGPVTEALLKRGLPADTGLTTGGEVQVSATIDPDSMPAADTAGAGRLAVDQLHARQRGLPR